VLGVTLNDCARIDATKENTSVHKSGKKLRRLIKQVGLWGETAGAHLSVEPQNKRHRRGGLNMRNQRGPARQQTLAALYHQKTFSRTSSPPPRIGSFSLRNDCSRASPRGSSVL
jgi:hypothetical protein